MRPWSGGRALPAALGVCGTLWGCGANDGVAPTPPPPATPAFVYVLTRANGVYSRSGAITRSLSTLRVTETGDLQLVGSLAIEQAFTIAADPGGRMLFVAGGGFTLDPAFLRAYSIDPTSGALSPSSEDALLGSFPHSVVAGEDTVYVISSYGGGGFIQASRFGPPGGPLDARPLLADGCDYDGEISWLLPGKPYLLIQDHGIDCSPQFRRSASNTAGVFVPGPKSFQLTRITGAALPGATTAAARAGDCVALNWSQGPGAHFPPISGGIATYAIDPATGVPSQRQVLSAGVVPAIASSPNGLVAATTTTSATQLRVYSTTATCDIQERFAIVSSPAQSLVFHPSGLFLYAIQNQGVQAYALTSDGSFSRTLGFTEGIEGQMAIAAPSS
jgi:hypothetical protein